MPLHRFLRFFGGCRIVPDDILDTGNPDEGPMSLRFIFSEHISPYYPHGMILIIHQDQGIVFPMVPPEFLLGILDNTLLINRETKIEWDRGCLTGQKKARIEKLLVLSHGWDHSISIAIHETVFLTIIVDLTPDFILYERLNFFPYLQGSKRSDVQYLFLHCFKEILLFVRRPLRDSSDEFLFLHMSEKLLQFQTGLILDL